MTMRIRLFFFLLLGFSVSAAAQTSIKGIVLDAATLLPIEDANISLSEEGSPIVIDFTVSDKKGMYSLMYKGKSERIIVSVSGFNLKKQSKTIENITQTLNFSIEEEEIRLNEVIVKAPKIRQTGDTLHYNVAQFAGQEDRSIGDVLRKMPGIEVRTDGMVLYQNRPINKFYIENLDILQGRYGIATNNINAKDVATVQVMENHQPVRALIGKEFVNEAALNLKLKESTKGAFFLKAQAGIGASPLLLSNELMAMYFARTMQHLSLYKGDNTGRDVSQELKSLYISTQEDINVPEMLRVVYLASPSIPQQRYLFNNAHTVTLNNLNKLGERYTLTTNLNYVNDKIERGDYSLSEYFLPENHTVRIEEEMNTVSRKNILDAAFNLNANTETYYFNNNLKFSGTWRKDFSTVLSNQKPVHQHLKTPDYSVSNFFDLVKNNDKRMYKIQSFVGYRNVHQELFVSPSILQAIFPSEVGVKQNAQLSAFETRNRLSWATTGRFSVDYSASFNASLHKLNTRLGTKENQSFIITDSLQNRIKRDYLEGVFSTSTGYNITPKMNIRATLPLRYLLLWHRNEKNTSDSFLYLDPFVILNWQLSARWSSNVMYGLTHGVGGIEKTYTNPVLLNYRLLMHNDDKLEKSLSQNAMWLLGYKNPFTAFFGSLSVFYNRSRQNLLGEYRYDGVFTTRTSVEKPNTSNNLTASLSVGKDVEALKSSLSLGISYSGNWSQQISQGEIVGYQSNLISVSPRIITKFGSFANVQYGVTYSHMQSRLDLPNNPLPRIETLLLKVDLNVFPTKNIVISFRCDYFRNVSEQQGNETMWFGDIGAKYKLKTVEFIVDWNNVFNALRYVSNSYLDAGRFYYSYKLRPSEVLLRVRFNIL
ncbi:MAG: carboxypeptidase-like regulatory domain-containing protein [Bacteroidia bacterium]|nr:carboxypeptidase-like regulatory domain-containing protein [Bacteroidia bacterium]